MTQPGESDMQPLEPMMDAEAIQSEQLPLTPTVALLTKVGSIARHVEEAIGHDGHALDRAAIEALLMDPEVQAWMKSMDQMALLPVKR
jgi:hypothetical protein